MKCSKYLCGIQRHKQPKYSAGTPNNNPPHGCAQIRVKQTRSFLMVWRNITIITHYEQNNSHSRKPLWIMETNQSRWRPRKWREARITAATAQTGHYEDQSIPFKKHIDILRNKLLGFLAKSQTRKSIPNLIPNVSRLKRVRLHQPHLSFVTLFESIHSVARYVNVSVCCAGNHKAATLLLCLDPKVKDKK